MSYYYVASVTKNQTDVIHIFYTFTSDICIKKSQGKEHFTLHLILVD